MYPRADFGDTPVLAACRNVRGCDQVSAHGVGSRGSITEGGVAAAAVAPPPPPSNAPSGSCLCDNFGWSWNLVTNLHLWEHNLHAPVHIIICAAF